VIEQVAELLQAAANTMVDNGVIPADAKYRIQVDRTKDKSHGDLATNLAMMLAKPCKQNPRAIAQLIIDSLPASDLIVKTDIAGPGFINFFLNQNQLLDTIAAALTNERLNMSSVDQPQVIVVDYSSPNLAKEMHVGHLRSTIIGDAVARTLEFVGHTVIRQNHVGNWGTQFGMLLAFLEEAKKKGDKVSMELADLEHFYRQAKLRFDESEDFKTRARELVVTLQSGDEYCLSLWQEFNDISLGHCQATYEKLNVSLTVEDIRGESAYNDDLPKIISDLSEQGLLQDSEGAKCVFSDDFKRKDGELLPLIVQKKDGGFLYATTDLAAIRYRNFVLQADRVLYFVDARQALHFQQVFSTAKKAGFIRDSATLEHMPFGMVLGDDGKPFKTREGGVAKLADLIDESIKRATDTVRSRASGLTEEEIVNIGNVVGVAAVKYADLSKSRTSDYQFSWEQMLSLEGNTAPYLLYAYARVKSILRRGEVDEQSLSQGGVLQIEMDQEVALANKLAQCHEVIGHVATKGMPHLLCTYLFELASTFSTFFEACPVLKADTEEQKQSRLKLALLTAKTLQLGLGLLGIQTLEKM
jgi:arginyl-tRNA synthetase